MFIIHTTLDTFGWVDAYWIVFSNKSVKTWLESKKTREHRLNANTNDFLIKKKKRVKTKIIDHRNIKKRSLHLKSIDSN